MLATSPPIVRPATLPAARPFVLLVDDHEPSLRGLCQVVEGAGHRCVAARSPTDALLYCTSRRPQVVVTDLSMPGLDGGVLAAWLRVRYPGIPLVLVTGNDLDDPSMVPLRAVFRAILPKPIDLGRLLDLLDELMPGDDDE